MASPEVSEAERIAMDVHNRKFGRGFTFCYFALRSRLKTMFFYARRLSNNCVMAM